MEFDYKAKDSKGATVTGKIEGDSEIIVRQRLRGQGLFPIAITPLGGSRLIKPSGSRSSIPQQSFKPQPRRFFPAARVKQADLVVAFSQLSIMCQSGEDLAEALKSLASQCTQPNLKVVLQSCYDDVAQGVKFSVALAKHPRVFNESLTSAIAAGEHAGRIVDVLDRLTQLMRKDQQLSSSIGAMMMYPVVLCSITSVVIAAMFFFVLPQFAIVFHDSGRPVPPLTSFLLSIGSFLRANAFWIVGSIGLAIVGAITIRKHPTVKRTVDYWILHSGVLNKPVRSLMAGRIFRLLGTMLENDVPLLQSVQLVRRACRNALYFELFDKIEKEILQGEGMSQTLVSADFLPTGAAHMISTGEKSGKLSSVLQSIGEYFEDEGERTLRTTVKIMEPAIIVCLGIVVGTVVMSIVLPLLDITTIS